ncbi:hypothetical protein F5B21DRAFT_487400 [Xylaria acuta]|nr:hypothetical protein F5B21DRAFT_487400 [Xylaria acuta]
MSISAPTVISEPERALDLARPSTFCKAFFFFYACGCRTPEPFFCCRPHPDVSPRVVHASNPCQHETPSVVVAKLPHACKAGKTEACGAVDPALLAFVREVDTAERLDLTILRGIPRDEIDTALPKRVDGAFTVGQVAVRSLDRRGNSPAFSPASVRSDVMAVEDPSDAVGNREDDRVVQSVRHGGAHILIDSTREDMDGVERGGDQRDGEFQQGRKNSVIAETVCEEVRQPEDDDGEGSEEFFDIETLAPTPEYAVSESSTSRAERTVKSNEPESAGDIGGYDDMMMFWALDDNKSAHQIGKTSSWSISSLLGKFSNRRF